MSTNCEDDIAVGKPVIDEIIEYFSCEGSKHNDSSFAPSSANSSDYSLDESFKEFLNLKIQNKLQSKMNNFNESCDLHGMNKTSIMGGDDTFARMERLCDRSLNELVPMQLDNNDITLLNEVNEPSMFWENTIQKLSPVKLCGLLRPSTIMEEDSQDISDVSEKSNKTQTTVKVQNGEESSYSYKTAQEEESSQSTLHSSLENLIDFNVLPSIKKKNYYYDDKGNFISPRSSSGKSKDISEYATATSSKSPDDVIELSSSSDESTEKTESIANTLDDVSSINDISFEPDSLDVKGETSTNSLNFNDTIEEMEYMMKQGLKLIQEKKNLNETLIVKATACKSPFKPATPLSQNLFLKKRDANKPVYKSSHIGSSSSATVNNVPKSFKKPIAAKVPSAKKKGGYDYIVSPIGMYIKNTPTIPLTKTGNSRRDIFESKLAHIRDSTPSSRASDNAKEMSDNNSSPCPFPRKAYFNAENNHVIDERVNPKLIGGDKVHRLFGGYNRSPTITKHQGRIKITNSSHKKENKPLVDDSFKDLSLISGDVSFHVVKSAKKY